MRKRLWKIPDMPTSAGVVLLGQEADIVAQREEAFESLRRFIVPPHQGETVRKPERAGQESALIALNTIQA